MLNENIEVIPISGIAARAYALKLREELDATLKEKENFLLISSIGCMVRFKARTGL